MTAQNPSSSRAGIFLALGAAGLAALLYLLPGNQPSLRVTPVELESWRAHLIERGDARASLSDPLETFARKVTGGRIATVEGRAWDGLFRELQQASGRWREDARADWRTRISDEDESHVTAVFFPVAEAPFSSIEELPEPGERIYLRRAGAPAELLEVLHVAAGVSEGEVTTSRFFKSRWTLPVAFSHPLRGYSWWLLAFAALALVSGPVLRLTSSSSTGPYSIPNHRRTSTRQALAAFLLAFGACFLPAVVEMDMMNGGYALIVLSGMVALTALITFVMLGRSADRLDRILAGQEVLAHWQYAPQEWRRFVEVEYGISSGEKKALFRLVAIIAVVVGVGFVLVVRDEASLIVFSVLMGLLVFLRLLVSVLPAARHRRMLSQPGQALVAYGGVYFGGEFHDFAMADARLEGVELLESQGTVMLACTYSFQVRHGRQTEVARVPVPQGREEEARMVAMRLAARLSASEAA